MYRLKLNRFLSLLCGLVAIVCRLCPAYGQERTVVRANQQWIQYYGQLQLTERWYLTGDTGFRWKDGLTTPHQNIFRVGTLYRPDNLLHLGGGLAYSGFYEAGKVEHNEWRLYQEAGMRHYFRSIELAHRFRMEQRFQHPTTFVIRFRYALTASIPLFSLSAKNRDQRLSLIAGDEIFINSKKEITNGLFDQNRFLAGLSADLSDALSIAVIWNSQFAATMLPSTYRHTHVAWLQLRHQINLPKTSRTL